MTPLLIASGAILTWVAWMDDDPGAKLCLLALVLLLPALRHFFTRKGALLAAALAVHFGFLAFPGLLDVLALEPADPTAAATLSLELLLAACVALVAAYGLVRRWLRPECPVAPEPPVLAPWAVSALAALLVASLFLREPPSFLAHAARQLQVLGVILLYTGACPRSPRRLRVLRLVFPAFILVDMLQTGFLFFGTLVGITWLMLTVIDPTPRRLATLFTLALAVASLQMVKFRFRQMLPVPGLDTTDKVHAIGRMLTKRLLPQGESEPSALTRLRWAAQRISDDSLERVLALTPDPVPYWDGYTYAPLATFWIPRAVWPEKPAVTFWQEFGHRYRILQPNDTRTSVHFNYLTEGYMNFGRPGLFAAAALFGVLLALLSSLVEGAGRCDLFALVVAAKAVAIPIDALTLVSQVAFALLALGSLAACRRIRDVASLISHAHPLSLRRQLRP